MSCCAVTGANGFVGAHVVRELLHRGHEVVALVGAEQDSLSLDGLDVGLRELDIRDPGSVRAALAGADAVVHAAATYAFWAADRHDIYRVNVDGTRNVLEAARHLGVGRLVHVSSAATLAPTSENADDPARPSGEDGVLDLSRFRGHYKASKAMAEKLAVRAGAVVVRPTTVIGPGDRRPTPSGSMILHYLEGHMKVLVEMRQNVVDVRDVASGIALALERGATGGRYVLGGDNMTMRRLCALLEELTGIPAPRMRLPLPLLWAAGAANEWVADHVTRRPPLVTREDALHARDSRFLASGRASRELGYEPRTARAALAAAVRFFAEEGYVSPPVAERVLRGLPDPG